MSGVSLSVDSAKARLLGDWISRIHGPLCVITHRNADPDAIASALAAGYIARALNQELTVKLLIPEGMELISKKVLDDLGLSSDLRIGSEEGCKAAIVVDASTRDQLGEYAGILDKVEYVVIDHHEVNELTSGNLNPYLIIHSRNSSATSELIAEIAMMLNIRLPKKVLTLLIAGILYDSKMLRLANHETFYVMHWLTFNGGEYGRALKILTSREVSWSETIAKLKGVSRAGIYKLGSNYLLAVTCIGAFESSVLKLLIDAGADVAIAVARRKEAVRIIIRSTPRIIKGLNEPVASSLAQHLAREFNGSGGGHAGAAGVIIKRDVSPDDLMRSVKRFFEGKGLSVNTLEEGRWVVECD